MRKILFAVAFVLPVFFFSCQKEIDWGIGGGSGSTLLVKVVQNTGTDSVVSEYSYDASKRLIKEKITGQSGGMDIGNDRTFVRNSSGIITKIIQKAAAFIALGLDSVETIVHYDQASARYTSSVLSISLFGFSILDSAAYNYDGSGMVVNDIHYQSFIGPYAPSLKEEYTYTAGDITVLKQSSYNTATLSYDLVSTLSFTYDSKINPLKMNNEAFVILATYFSAHNATVSDFVDATDPANNFTINAVYTYNSNNKPASAVNTQNPGATITNVTFYYQ